MPKTQNKTLKLLKEYLIITFGLLCYVLSWTVFLVPNNLVGGGVTGIASIIQYATGGAIKAGYSFFAINVVLLIVAVMTLGKAFGSKTVYAVVLVSVGLNVFQRIMPPTIIQAMALDNGKLMSTIMGGILAGVGIGMAMSQGGSTGGTDIIALIVNKYRGISPGRMILSIDVVVILSSMLIPSYTSTGELMPIAEKVTTVVYGLILITVNSTVLDMYLSGSKQSVQLFIISKKSAEIADAITKDLHRGVTVLNGEGWYTKQNMEVLMVLTLKADLNVMLKYIKAIDANAFVSVASVAGVYGQGFDTIRIRSRKKT